jgi:enamine deaminase RidA (YjgF/YER057c/UK114 family)
MNIHRIRSTDRAGPLHQAEAIVAGPFVFTSAQMATDWVHGIAPEARVDPSFPFLSSAVGLQTDYALRSLARTLHAAGSGLDHVVKAYVFLADCSDFLEFDRVWKGFFPKPTTRTGLGAAGLLLPEARLEIALIAVRPDAGIERRGTNSDAPRPLTNKVEAMRAGDFVFTAGQLAHNARDGVPPEAAGPGGAPDMARQVAYTVGNLGLSLKAAGASLDRVVRGQAFLRDMGEHGAFDAAWSGRFGAPPARTVVGAGSLNVGGALLEIDLTAYVGASEPVRVMRDEGQGGPRCVAVRCGELVFSGGVLPGPEGGRVPASLLPHPAYPNYSSAIEMQTEAVLDRLDGVLAECGSGLDLVLKAQVLLTDLGDFHAFERVWRRRFPSPPARSVIRTAGLPVEGAKVSVEVVAAARPEPAQPRPTPALDLGRGAPRSACGPVP